MTALNRKLIRDVFHLRGQLVAAALVVMCGVASYVTMRSAYNSLLTTQQAYYNEYRFADLFARLKRAPEGLADRIRGIPGVSAINTRVVVGVTLDVPGLNEPATGLLVSLPERRRPVLNDIFLRKGRYFEPGRKDEILVSEAFAVANNLDLGAKIGAVINGTWKEFTVVGIALSPEYVYEIGAAAMLPDNRRFGVLWADRETLAAAFNMRGAFNDLALTLAHGADEKEVIARLDVLLQPYGGVGAFGRSEQTSHVFLTSELDQLETTGTIIPAIFLGVAAFLLNIVLSRLVRTQRDQIAVLKAFGYGNVSIGLHYLGMAMVAVLAGGLAGIALGMWAGSAITEVYAQFYRFPLIRYVAGPSALSASVLISGGAALLGALSAVRAAIKLPPAEAMRPESPARFRPGLLERLGFQRFLSTSSRMIFRSLERNPLKAFLSTLGIALSVAILIIGRYTSDAIDTLMNFQFEGAQREDATVIFNNPLSSRAEFDLLALPGVLYAEPFRTVPAELSFGHRSKRAAITGFRPGSRLRRVMDMDGVVHSVPRSGLLMTRQLGEILGAAPGDTLRLEVLEGKRPQRQIVIAGFIDEFAGLNAYMEMDALAGLLAEGGELSGAYLMIDRGREDDFNRALKETPAVAGAMFRRAALESFNRTVAESQGISRGVMIFFACVIAVGVLYNSARISLSERGRELASLRVLGFRKGEVAFYLLGEQGVLVLLALPLGYLLGYAMVIAMVKGFESELFRFPMVISPQTLAFASLVVLGAALFSALLVRRRIFNLDLIEVLKTRE